MRDSYLKFFKKFNITEDQLIDYGLSDIIFIPQNEAKKEWNNLKRKVLNNQETFIRGLGRDAANTPIMIDIHYHLFTNSNIKKDPTNNAGPQRLLEKLTGYSKKKSKLNKELRNYQVSHVFGLTKNALAFNAPWNIVYMPKLFDPFTGHESKGEITKKFTNELKKIIYFKFKDLIEEYNEIVDSEDFKTKMIKALNKLETDKEKKYPFWRAKNLLKTVENEFKPIKIH